MSNEKEVPLVNGESPNREIIGSAKVKFQPDGTIEATFEINDGVKATGIIPSKIIAPIFTRDEMGYTP